MMIEHWQLLEFGREDSSCFGADSLLLIESIRVPEVKIVVLILRKQNELEFV